MTRFVRSIGQRGPSHPALDTPRWANGRSADAPATVGRSRHRAAMATLWAVLERETQGIAFDINHGDTG
jgi:hypothetical protein